jgi:beta-glucosidase
MSVVMDDGKRVVHPVEVRFSIGGEQPGFSGLADAVSTSTIGGSFRITGSAVELPK